MLIDTHCHLNADVFKNRWRDVISQANAAGVQQFFVVGWDQVSSLAAITLATQSPQIKAVIGLHPVDVKGDDSFDWITSAYRQHASSIVAIGEIGLDFYWKKTEAEHQQQTHALIQQIAIANQLGLPVVIHCRDAYEAILPILKTNPVKRGGVMHCYAGPSHLVSAFIDLGFYLSFGGPITFKNADVARESLTMTPLDRLLIETDSPYLSPTPHRGKENTPTYLPFVFDKMCAIKHVEHTTLQKQLIENTIKLFHVKTL